MSHKILTADEHAEQFPPAGPKRATLDLEYDLASMELGSVLVIDGESTGGALYQRIYRWFYHKGRLVSGQTINGQLHIRRVQ